MIGISGIKRRIAAALVLVALAAPLAGTSPLAANSAGTSAAFEAVCPAATPGTAQCLALLRTDIAAPQGSAVTPSVMSGYLAPADIQSAYALPTGSQGSGLTVAIVDAYDLPTAEADLAAYRSYWGLPPCTSASGCFRKVNQSGGTDMSGVPSAVLYGWAYEIALDIDMVSAACPYCKILLVEANNNMNANLGTSVNTAVSLGAIAVSNSYGGAEWSGESSYDALYYNHPGVAITASTGDCGYNCDGVYGGTTYSSVLYPAASQYVIAVGGTSLTHDSSVRGWHESAWGNADGGAGSGCSLYEPKPSWQHDTGCAKRTQADVSAVADPATGVYIYANGHWYVSGGTSAASPIIAATYALAGRPVAGTYPASYLYGATGSLYDVVGGNNDVTFHSCTVAYLCNGVAGYDGPTGLGTPNGIGAFTGLAVPGKPTAVAATAGNAAALVSWVAPASNGAAITGYTVTSSPDGKTCASTTATNCIVTGLTNGTAYTFTVVATNSVGPSLPSDPSAPVTPSASQALPATSLALSGIPSPAVSGTACSLTVTAGDGSGSTAAGYVGTVHFTSSDPAAILPPDYTYTSADWGVHVFSVTLRTYGTQSVTAADTATSSINGSQSGITVTWPAATYHAIQPARVLDTRPDIIKYGVYHMGVLTGPFAAGVVRTFHVANAPYVGGAGVAVPANAVAVTGNLTITGETSAGLVALGPTVTSSGEVTTVNFNAIENRADNVTVGLALDGSLQAVFRGPAGRSTDLIFDITGYFTPDTTGATYHTVTPGRLLDTRANGFGNIWIDPASAGPKPFASQVVRTVKVAGVVGLGWTSAQVPSDATAVTANMTVTDQTSNGYVSFGPTISSSPKTSTLNVLRGNNTANGITVALNNGNLQAVWVGTPGSSADVILDITGFFTNDQSGYAYHAIAPARFMDSWTGRGAHLFTSQSPQTLNVGGVGDVPADAAGISGNLTLWDPTVPGYLYVGPLSETAPKVSTVNASARANSANGFDVQLSSTSSGVVYVVFVGTGGTATVSLDVTGYWK